MTLCVQASQAEGGKTREERVRSEYEIERANLRLAGGRGSPEKPGGIQGEGGGEDATYLVVEILEGVHVGDGGALRVVVPSHGSIVIRSRATGESSGARSAAVAADWVSAGVTRVRFASRSQPGCPNGERRAVWPAAFPRRVYSRARGRFVRRAPRFRRHLRRRLVRQPPAAWSPCASL